jgi:hypothetical protein
MRKLFFLFLLLAGASKVMQAQITWNFTSTSSYAGTLANTLLGSVSQVNNNGTTTFLAAVNPLSSGYAGSSGANNGNFSARVGALSTVATSGSAYLQFVITPNAGYWLNITNINWGNYSFATGPTSFTIYTSANNYTSPVGTATALPNSTWAIVNSTLTAPILGFTGTALTIRIYAHGGTGTAPAATVNWRVDDLNITATVQTGAAATAIPKFLTATTFASSVMTENNGRIGVGTATPAEKLDVVGNLRFSGALMPNGDAGTTTTALYLKSAGANAPPVWAAIAGGGGGLTAITASNIVGQQTWTITNPTTTTANIGLSLTSAAVGLGNVTNESKATMFTSPIFTGTPVFPAASIPNNALANNSVTIGTTNIALGATAPSLAGLNSVTSTTFNGALNGNATSATNIAGGGAGAIPYQTGVGTTGMSAAGTSGYVLTSGGAGAPTWTAATALPSNAWSLDGNTNATATSFLGTATGNDIDLIFKRNGVISGRLNDAFFNTSFGVNSQQAITGVGGSPVAAKKFNSSFGYGALQNIQIGYSNTAFGYNTLNATTSTNLNTAIGSNVLEKNISVGNTGLGTRALLNNTLGSYNIGLGYGALLSNVSGMRNIGLGANSLFSNTVENYNIGIGDESDIAVGVNYSTAIGYKSYVSQSNSLVLGSIGVANGTTLSTNVGIGTSAPTQKLEVKDGNILTNQNIYASSATSRVLIGDMNGLNTGAHALAVNGTALFTKATVRLTGTWPDFVFEPTYNLPTLSQVEAYITKHKHLEGVPSAEEVKEKGIDLGDNQTILLKKVEELTLYMIELNKKVETLAKENEELKKKVNGDK